MSAIDREKLRGMIHLTELLSRIDEVIKKLADVPGALEGRNSGYFSIRRWSDGRMLRLIQVGECPMDKAEKYETLCREKGKRLFNNKHNLSSWQSRDEAEGHWGGAVVIPGGLIFSFSGLAELTDEAVVLMAAVLCADISLTTAKKIAKISKNTVFEALVKLFPQTT